MVNPNEITEEMREQLAFSDEDRRGLERARSMPITFDEDCPEVTPEKAVHFRRVNPPRRLD